MPTKSPRGGHSTKYAFTPVVVVEGGGAWGRRHAPPRRRRSFLPRCSPTSCVKDLKSGESADKECSPSSSVARSRQPNTSCNRERRPVGAPPPSVLRPRRCSAPIGSETWRYGRKHTHTNMFKLFPPWYLYVCLFIYIYILWLLYYYYYFLASYVSD